MQRGSYSFCPSRSYLLRKSLPASCFSLEERLRHRSSQAYLSFASIATHLLLLRLKKALLAVFHAPERLMLIIGRKNWPTFALKSSSEEESSSMTSLLLCFGLKREGAGASSSEPRAFFFFFRPLMAEPASASDSLSLIRPSSASFLFLCSRKKYILRMSWSLITFRRFRSRGAVLELLRRLVYFF